MNRLIATALIVAACTVSPAPYGQRSLGNDIPSPRGTALRSRQICRRDAVGMKHLLDARVRFGPSSNETAIA